METKLGIEVDCSIGGMNGADTSLYALKMCQKYERYVQMPIALAQYYYKGTDTIIFLLVLVQLLSH
jgi:hypothetical protein